MRTFNPNKIKERRLMLKLSQQKLASISGLSREHLNTIERGKHTPRVDTIARLAESLGVEVSYFFTEQTEQTEQKEV